jgi:hypothetical protein
VSNHAGSALELAWCKTRLSDIEGDLEKLIDPENGYLEMVYFAYGRTVALLTDISRGLESALDFVRQSRAGLLLPVGLHILAAVRPGTRESPSLWEFHVEEPCLPQDMEWSPVTWPRKLR